MRALLVLILVAAAGCGSAINDYCDKWAECEGGNEKDRDACVVILEGDARAAGIYDCSEEWNDRLECREKYATCEGDDLRFNGACDSERDKLDACIDAASANEP
jgi:hypothetical protein